MKRLARPLASVVGLVALVAGVPALLITVVGWPLPHNLPALSEVRSALGDGWRPGQRFVLGVLGLVTWLLWAQMTRHVVAEIRLLRRDAFFESMPASSGHRGPSGRLAAWLVGGLVLLGPVTAVASSPPAIPVVLAASRALDSPAGPPIAPLPPAQPEAAPSPTYVVHTWEERQDCLWTIAERYLGDPFRWSELAELNAEVRQPGGRRLGDDPRHWVYPGMQLRLPADATGPDLRPARAPGPGTTPASPAQDGSSAGSLDAQASVPNSPPALLDKRGPRRSTGVPNTATPNRANKRGRPVASKAAPEGAKEPAPVVRLGRGVMLVAQAIGLGLPVFAAGGLVRHLNRRRRVQVARHRPGRDIVRPDPDGEALELKARAIAADEAAVWVDAAMRLLGARIAEAAMAVPAVTCVRAGELGLEILLGEPRPLAPAGFVSADDGFVWRLDAEADLSQFQAEAEKHPATAPALVSLGVSPEGPLLVDLEAIGALSVEGAPDRVAAFIAGVALELAAAPWSDGVDLRLVGTEPGLGAVEGMEVVEDCASLVSESTQSPMPPARRWATTPRQLRREWPSRPRLGSPPWWWSGDRSRPQRWSASPSAPEPVGAWPWWHPGPSPERPGDWSSSMTATRALSPSAWSCVRRPLPRCWPVI